MDATLQAAGRNQGRLRAGGWNVVLRTVVAVHDDDAGPVEQDAGCAEDVEPEQSSHVWQLCNEKHGTAHTAGHTGRLYDV